MIERILLVAWKGSPSVQWAATLEAAGYTVLLEETTGERAWRTAKERGIDCVVIDGDKKPSMGRQTGHQLRDTAKTRGIPIVWANLNPEEGGIVQAEVHPDVTLPRPTEASEVVAAILSVQAEREPGEEGAGSVAAVGSEVAVAESTPDPVVTQDSEERPERGRGESTAAATPGLSGQAATKRASPAKPAAKKAAAKRPPAKKTASTKRAAKSVKKNAPARTAASARKSGAKKR